MSASPPSSPPRRPLHQRSNSQNNRLQIRIVPYSPPRLSDASASTQAVQDHDADPESSPLPSPSCRPASPTESLVKASASVSGLRRPSSLATPVPHSDSTIHDDDDDDDDAAIVPPRAGSSRSSVSSSRSPSRRPKKVIYVNPDKTFSLLPQTTSASSRTDSLRSPPPSCTTPSSSYGRMSSGAFSDLQPSGPETPLTPLVERSVSPSLPASSPTPHPESLKGLGPESSPAAQSSPWNYRMVGGVRKVPKTLDRKQKQPQATQPASFDQPLPPLPEVASVSAAPVLAIRTQPIDSKPSSEASFPRSESTVSDRTNYKVYGQSSPVVAGTESESRPPSSSHSNYRVLGESSSDPSIHDQTRPQTGESDANYVVHGGLSPLSPSLSPAQNPLRVEYSQESLVVAPLRPNKKRSTEHIGLHKPRSRDTLRTGSLTSISSILTQEATRALFAGPVAVYAQGGHRRQGSGASSLNLASTRPQVSASFPHQWSSQLSTVASESERGSDAASRSLSPTTSAPGRRSSGFNSNHSRNLLSISSSLAGLEEYSGSSSHSRSGSLDRPPTTYNRNAIRDPNSGIRLIKDHDEDGDGLADLELLHHRPSRTRMSSFLSNRSSDRNLRSSGSSRANSFNSGAIPTWAKLYYGSGERRYLAALPSTESLSSAFCDSRPGSSFMNRTPSADRYATSICSPRRRPQDPSPHRVRRESETGSLDITPAPPNPGMAVVRGMKKQTSSLWSPHLQHDRRIGRYSIWEPPAAEWAVDSSLLGRRNVQLVLFLVGFIFPFAWMIAAFLPLPLNPYMESNEGDKGKGPLDSHEPPRQMHMIREIVYNSAKWWRNLNRIMSVVGVLVIGAVIALIVVGVQQQWGR